jgi:hypothetical protein
MDLRRDLSVQSGDVLTTAPTATPSMNALIAEHAWDRTSLGSKTLWPQSLTSIVDLVTASPLATIVLWGPELIQIYNDGYAVICGPRHPAALGQATRDCWPEVWAFNEPAIKPS